MSNNSANVNPSVAESHADVPPPPPVPPSPPPPPAPPMPEPETYERVLANRDTAAASNGFLAHLNKDEPGAIAKKYLNRYCLASDEYGTEHYTLKTHGGVMFQYREIYWEAYSEDELRAAIRRFLERCTCDGATPFVKFRDSLISEIVSAIEDYVIDVKADIDDSGEYLHCVNGHLNLKTLKLEPHSVAFFNLGYSEVTYDPNALVAPNWFAFLNSIWPNDQTAWNLVHEMIGYTLSGQRDLEKVFFLKGPPRAGKGTILKILQALLGETQYCAPKLNAFASRFGLESAVGKSAMLVTDANFKALDHAKRQAAIETILAISGRDPIEVERKNITNWLIKRAPWQIIMATNGTPFSDNAGAMAARAVMLTFRKSFASNPDSTLIDRLMTELPAILNWSIMSLLQLRARGHFVMTEDGKELADEVQAGGSNVRRFAIECCSFNGGMTASKTLFLAYVRWCENQRIREIVPESHFFTDLYNAFPDLVRSKPRINGAQVPHVLGIELVQVDGLAAWPMLLPGSPPLPMPPGMQN